jgi:hypothetical protein
MSGSGEYYPGGSVFASREDAERAVHRFPGRGYAVFGVDASWEADTEPSLDGSWHDLLRDAVIITLDQE